MANLMLKMELGTRSYRSASLRLALPSGLPEEMHGDVIEIQGVMSDERGSGHARALMAHVCTEADLTGKTLFLMAEPFADGMTAEQLRKFYEKHGFEEIQAEPCLMVRSPQKPSIVRLH